MKSRNWTSQTELFYAIELFRTAPDAPLAQAHKALLSVIRGGHELQKKEAVWRRSVG
jgi:hypothetical protein